MVAQHERTLIPPGTIVEFTPNDKSGTVATAVAHTFCAVVGAGVLALPQAVAWLGWVAGPTCIVAFFLVSLMSSKMLAQVYEVDGVEHSRYHHAVRHLLGHRSAIWVSVFQLLNILLTTIAYTITGVSGIKGVATSICRINGTPADSCYTTTWVYTLAFGGCELVLSQVKNLEDAWWMSALGTIGSLIYAVIAFVLSAVHVGNGEGTVAGITGVSTANKVFGVANALGSIAFSYNFSLLLLEIQDTLRQPPSAVSQMRQAVNVAISGSFAFYIGVAVTGYAANGNAVAGQVLESYTGPNWALVVANVAVVLHMLTAYQTYGQAMFNSLESHVKWWQLRREVAKAKGAEVIVSEASATAAAAAATAAKTAQAEAGVKASPFDAVAEGTPVAQQDKPGSHLGLDHIQLAPISERLSSRMSAGVSGTVSIALAKSAMRPGSRSAAVDGGGGGFSQQLSQALHYNVDTGFANEEVPLNEEHFYAPLYARLIIRSAYVLLITLLACVMPFFSAFAGLVGAVTFFPLAIFFPFALYRKVYTVSGFWNVALWVIWVVLLVVALLATVGSVRTIITSWSTFTFFS